MAKRAMVLSPVKRKIVRADPVKRGYSGPWRRYSEKFRRRFPVCVSCVDYQVKVYCVDHIIPVNGPGDPNFMSHWNHQPLCRRCHGMKTERHDERLSAQRSTLTMGLDALELERSTEEARNELLRRAEIWTRWFDLADYSILEIK